MAERVVADLVAFADQSTRQLGVFEHTSPDDEERGADIMAIEYIEHRRRPTRIGAIIKRQSHRASRRLDRVQPLRAEVQQRLVGAETGACTGHRSRGVGVADLVGGIPVQEQGDAEQHAEQRREQPMPPRLTSATTKTPVHGRPGASADVISAGPGSASGALPPELLPVGVVGAGDVGSEAGGDLGAVAAGAPGSSGCPD